MSDQIPTYPHRSTNEMWLEQRVKELEALWNCEHETVMRLLTERDALEKQLESAREIYHQMLTELNTYRKRWREFQTFDNGTPIGIVMKMIRKLEG